MKNEGVTRRTALLGSFGLGVFARAEAADRLLGALGQSALKVARPTQAVLQAVARAGKSRRLVAVGERGLAIWSDDAGRSWTQASVPVRCTLTALRFADDKRGWAVGNMGVVLETEDGGASWSKRLDGQMAADLALQSARAQAQLSKPGGDAAARSHLLLEDAQRLVGEGADKPFLDIGLRADGSLLAVGAYGLAFASDDGGRTWRSQIHRLPNPEALTFYGLAERQGESFLFGEQGLLLRAKGPAAEFTTEASPSQGSLFGSLALRDGPLLLLGLRGKVWRSAGRDAPFTAVQTQVEASLISGVQLADGSALVVGSAGQALQSQDDGQSFQPLALSQRFPFTGVAQADDGALLLVGMRGLLRLSPADLKAAQASASQPSSRKPTA